MQKVVFILNSLHGARNIKRVISLNQGGFDVIVYGCNRGSHENNFPFTI
jgi:hypothetical protein